MILDFIQVNKIEGYEDVKDFYVICSDGRMINTNRLSYLKIKIYKDGYPKYDLYAVNGKQKHVKIHRILAQAFIPNPNNLPIVRHLNDDKLDWRLENLAWGTISDNNKDSYRNGRKLSGSVADPLARAKAAAKGCKKPNKPVRCVETGVVYPSTIEAQRVTGIDRTSIGRCCTGKQKTAGGLEWEWYQPQQAPNNIMDMSDYLEMNTSYRIN